MMMVMVEEIDIGKEMGLVEIQVTEVFGNGKPRIL
jgi:hypothetical protein